MTRAELALVLWHRHSRVTPPDLDTLRMWIKTHGKARLEHAFVLTGEWVTSHWFNHQRVTSEADAVAYTAGILRRNT